MHPLTLLDPETGLGKAGRSWTVGAQAVEVEYAPRLHTYRLLKAATVLDAGKSRSGTSGAPSLSVWPVWARGASARWWT